MKKNKPIDFFKLFNFYKMKNLIKYKGDLTTKKIENHLQRSRLEKKRTHNQIAKHGLGKLVSVCIVAANTYLDLVGFVEMQQAMHERMVRLAVPKYHDTSIPLAPI